MSRVMPDVEATLIGKRALRTTQARLELTKTEPRWKMALAFMLPPLLILLFGTKYAAFLGIRTDLLHLIGLLASIIIALALEVAALRKRLNAVASLVMQDRGDEVGKSVT